MPDGMGSTETAPSCQTRTGCGGSPSRSCVLLGGWPFHLYIYSSKCKDRRMSEGATAALPVKRRLVSAAFELARGQEWDSVAYTAIAERAGVSRPTLYAHFPSRSDLYEQVVAEAANEITTRVVDRAASARTGAEFVVEI